MTLDMTLAKAQQTVPECVAAGYVDMSTGMLLGVKTVDSHPNEVLDLVAAATAGRACPRSKTRCDPRAGLIARRAVLRCTLGRGRVR